MWDMCQMLNIWHISHTKHKKQLPIRFCICCKIIPFVSIPLQICNGTDRCGKPKIIILFDFSLSSHFFIWFSLSLLRICLSLSLSPKFPTCSSSSHNWMRARRRWRRRRRRRRWRPIIVILYNHHLSNKTQIQKNPTNPPRHHHILTHNHRNPPLHRNPQPPPLQIKLSPRIHYLRPQPQTKTINHRRLTLCGDHRQPPRRPSPTIANHRLQERRYGVRLGGDGFS